MKRDRARVIVNAFSFGAICGFSSASFAEDSPAIHIEDVAAFYKLYDATNGHPSADQIQRDYLDPGSDGLHNLAKVRNVTGTRIADNIARHPEIYSDASQCMAALPHVRQRVGVALRELGRLYPQARFPPVTIAVGRGKPVGVGHRLPIGPDRFIPAVPQQRSTLRAFSAVYFPHRTCSIRS